MFQLGCKPVIGRRILKTGKHSTIQISSTGHILRFLSIVYKSIEEDGIGLKRKYNKFQEIVKKQPYKTKSLYGLGVYKKGNCDKPYKAFITFNKCQYEENFKTPEEAKTFYDLKSIQFHGLLAYTNFPIGNYIKLDYHPIYAP